MAQKHMNRNTKEKNVMGKKKHEIKELSKDTKEQKIKENGKRKNSEHKTKIQRVENNKNEETKECKKKFNIRKDCETQTKKIYSSNNGKNRTTKIKKIGSEKNRLKGLEKVKSRALIKEMNMEFEIARIKKMERSKRSESLSKIFSMCSGNFVKLCFKRNTSKIIQCIIKYGSRGMIDQIFNEILADLQIVISKPFGKFVAEKLYQKNKRFQDAMFVVLQKNIKNILTDRISIHFLDDFYSDLENKAIFLEGLYLNERDILYKETEVPLEMIEIEFTINKMISKGLLNLEISHDVFELFIRILKAKKRDLKSFLLSISEFIPDLLYTKNGLKISIMIYEVNNDLASIYKSIEPYFLKIATDEYGVKFILMILESFECEIRQKIKAEILKLTPILICNENSSHLVMKYLNEIQIDENLLTHINENFLEFLNDYNYMFLQKFIYDSELLMNKAEEIMNGENNEYVNAKIYLEKIFNK